MTVLAGDRFTDSDGVGLDTHVADTGQGWLVNANFGDASPAPKIESDALVGQDSGGHAWYLNFSPASASYGVQVDITLTGSPQDYQFALYLHMDVAAQTAYILEWASGRFELHKVLAGTDTFLVGFTPSAFTSGNSYQIKLERGATANALDGYFKTLAATSWTPMWTAGAITDTSVPASGYAGIQTRLSNGFILDNFKVQDNGTAYDAAIGTPSPAMAVSPATIDTSTTGNTLTVTGTNTAWTTGTTFSVSAGSITATSVDAGTQVATLTYDAPSTAQTVTLTDSADSASATFGVTLSTLPLTLGALNLTATRFGIGVELKVSGDSANVANAVVQFKKTADPSFRYALGCEGGAPVKTYITADNDGNGKAFYCAILECSADTGYTVQVTVSCPSGVTGTNPVVGTITTGAECTFTPSGVAAPDIWVDPVGGSDTHGGTSWADAYQTIDKGITALNASGATNPVLGIGPGYPQASQTPITKAGSTVLAITSGGAANPATVDQNTSYSGKPFYEPGPNPANAGSRTVVHSGVYTTPTGSGDIHAGPWTQQTFVGPVDGLNHTVWKWTAVDQDGTAFTYAGVLGYASAKADEPERVASWNQSSLVVNGYSTEDATHWAELMQTNQMHNSGWYVDATDHQTIYLSLPGDLDPNDYYVWIGSQNNSSSGTQAGFTIAADGVTVCSFEYRSFQYDVRATTAATNWLVDHCYFALSQFHIYCPVTGTSYGTPTVYGHDGLVQHCLHKDSNLRAPNGGTPTKSKTIPWHLTKDYVVPADGSNYGVSVADLCQSLPFIANGCRRFTWRYNTVDGTHDTGAVSGEMQSSPSGTGVDRYQAQDLEMLFNVIRNIADDGPEPVSSCINGRAHGNWIDHSLTFYSGNSLNYGPFYLTRNQVWRTGTDGHQPGGLPNDWLPGTTIFKWGAVCPVPAWTIVAHNTLWTDSENTYETLTELVEAMGDFSGNAHDTRFWLKNNLVRSTATRIFQAPQNTVIGSSPSNDYWEEDYNQYASSHADTTDPNGVALDFGTDGTPVHDYGTIAAYRTGQGQGAHSNPVGTSLADVATLDAQFADAVGGELRLTADSGLIGAGTPLGNLSDILVADGGSLINGGYYGSAPDLGAVEYAGGAALTAALVGIRILASGLQVPYAIAATPSAVGLLSGTLAASYPLTAGRLGVFDAAGALAVPVALVAALDGVGTFSGQPVGVYRIAAQQQGVRYQSGTLGAAYGLVADRIGVGAFVGSFGATASLTAALIAVRSLAGQPGAAYPLNGQQVGVRYAGGALAAAYPLNSGLAGVGTIAGFLASSAWQLHGDRTGIGGFSGALVVPYALAGASLGVRNAGGTLGAAYGLTARLAGVGEATATLIAGYALAADLLRLGAATGDLAAVYAIDGTLLVVGTISAVAAAVHALGGGLVAVRLTTGALLSGLSSDIYVGGAVRANILGGAVRAPGPVPLQPGTVYGDGTYGDGLYGPQVLAAGGAVRANIVGGKARRR